MTRGAEIARIVDEELPEDLTDEQLAAWIKVRFGKDEIADIRDAMRIIRELNRQDILEKYVR